MPGPDPDTRFTTPGGKASVLRELELGGDLDGEGDLRLLVGPELDLLDVRVGDHVQVVFAPVAHFGNWLRVAVDMPRGASAKVLVTIHLKA